MKPVTMRQVAQHAGVDVSVVSRLLNDDPRLSISAPTRARVLESIAQLDYRPNLAARALRTSHGGMIAFVVPDFTSSVYAHVIGGAHRRAQEVGYALVVDALDPDLERLALQYRARGIDGVLLAGATLPDRAVLATEGLSVPMVLLNRQVAGLARTARVDYAAASKVACDHLADLGHRTVAVISSPRNADFRERLNAFRARARSRGMTVTTMPAPGISAEAGYNIGTQLARDLGAFTAVFCPTLMLGVGFLAAVNSAGVRVPERLSVMAMHDAEIASYTSPALSTVSLPMGELGALALDHLKALVDGEEPPPTVVETPPALMIRASTGPPGRG